MGKDPTRRLSKLLSWGLRHDPEGLGVALDPNGWARVPEVLEALARHGAPADRGGLLQVVANSDKQRFALSDDGERIRANQGHSVDVDVGLEAVEPPGRLFHGTVDRFLASILERGLEPRGRLHVHLSETITTARAVARRRGEPVVLAVAAAAMARAGHRFYRSANGVWLTEAVAPHYLEILD